ncbi:hypothetical protein CRV08_10870 [Halarcobacter ebronensis]|uniref:histidine kinase n=1 Tax=Halarcobacter ebronensis TaxID=1462615 RepID=A0A4Q0YAW4_9BACT|nr:7TM diverse intracellular signaling domain-containing protein [Halarcobacter ebronensis]RXJ67422.1 hypothetical protein CRV08_10870 [Halarcobacter ebronensis]
MLKVITVFHLFFIILFANNSTLIINNKIPIYDDFEISYIKDYSKNLTIEDIEKKEFNNFIKNGFSLGYSNNTTWIKIDILNKSDKENFILTLNETFYEKANLYYKKDGKWIKKENGLLTYIDKREVSYNKLSFIFDLIQNESSTIYLEIYGKYSYFGKIIIYDDTYFKQKNFFDSNNFYIFILGITSVILFFTIGLCLTLKEKIYYYYAGYIFFNIIFLIKISGILTYLDLQKYIYVLNMSGAYLGAFLILFSIEYLEIKTYLKKYYSALRLSSLLYFFIGFMFFFQYEPWNRILNSASLLISLVLLPLSIYIYYKGNKKSIYYTFAQVIFFIFAILFILMIAGILEYNNYTRYGIAIGSTLENLIFLILIIKRYDDLKESQLKAQNELLTIKNSQEEILKKEVETRTKELIIANNRLSDLVEERELLLKEILHRVKNNFHMIIGMLWFEEQKHKDTNIFSDLTNRLKSMSKIHEYLLKDSSNIKDIDVRSYFKEVIQTIVDTYTNKKVNIIYSIPDLQIKFDNAISLTIIINEIVNNCIKHNDNLDNIKIFITLEKNDEIVHLQIRDKGKGFDIKQIKEGLGLKLIKDYAKKLKNSTYNFSIDEGMLFNLEYKEEIWNINF